MAHKAEAVGCDILEDSVSVTVRRVVRTDVGVSAEVRTEGFVHIAGEVYRWETVSHAVPLTQLSNTSSVPLFPDEIGL